MPPICEPSETFATIEDIDLALLHLSRYLPFSGKKQRTKYLTEIDSLLDRRNELAIRSRNESN